MDVQLVTIGMLLMNLPTSVFTSNASQIANGGVEIEDEVAVAVFELSLLVVVVAEGGEVWYP
jgi:hypothetical protein